MPIVYKFWGSQPPGPLKNCPGWYRDDFTLIFTYSVLHNILDFGFCIMYIDKILHNSLSLFGFTLLHKTVSV